MPVKDLITKYNDAASASTITSPTASKPAMQQTINPSTAPTGSQPSTLQDAEASSPRRARFLNRASSALGPSPLGQTDVPVLLKEEDPLPSQPESGRRQAENEQPPSSDTVSVSRATGSRLKQWLSSVATNATDTDESAEYEMLISKRKPYTPASPSEVTEPGFRSIASSATAVHDNFASQASTITLAPNQNQIPHTPIPLPVIFSRKSAPLHLPKLDKYISTLPPPHFPHNPAGSDMFPPMDRLVKLGRSLEELETNYVIPPWWRNKKSILGTIVNTAFSITGSSALAAYYSLHGVLGTVQIFALILSTIVPISSSGLYDKWRQLFLGTIPNILALNFASTVTQSLIFLLLFMAITSFLLWYFYRCTTRTANLKYLEGLQAPDTRAYGRFLVFVTFLLIIVYLPISTMSVHVLVFSDDLWVVDNPYKNATSFPPKVAPLGPPDEYRDPLDFCYTTTMKRNEINWAPGLVIMALTMFSALTIWFPLQLHRAIKRTLPKVDRYTAIGTFRSKSDMDREYQRLLDRDRSPFAFLYNQFRRGWGTFESVYLMAKFSALLIIAVINADNCLFRNLPRKRVTIVRQILLLVGTVVAFAAQCVFVPFRNPANNASEWVSRMNYVITSLLALLVALNVPGKHFLNGAALYIVYALTYGLSFYFTIIDTDIVQRIIKRWVGRVDFSIDIFSPRIDVSPSSPHTHRRIWQESITTLLLTSANCRIPKGQRMQYAEAPDDEYPPYLLNFAGSPAERHIENLKIFREVGPLEYGHALLLVYGPDRQEFKRLAEQVQRHYIGPDCYWKPNHKTIPLGCKSYFGHAWWIPFPPTVVIQYDDGPLAVIKGMQDIQAYVAQNASFDIKRRCEIRMAVRALDGQTIRWPYDHIQLVGFNNSIFPSRRYRAQSVVHYESCQLQIKRRGLLEWENLHLGSGFEVELVYAKNVRIPGGAIGIEDDYNLTQPLARFLTLNERLIPARLTRLEEALDRYRLHCMRECTAKAHTLSYRFLSVVYNSPEDIPGLGRRVAEQEPDERMRALLKGHECGNVFTTAYKRLTQVSTSEVATWWYIFWDDLWRRNFDTITALRTFEADFNPHFPSSIAYRPLPRPALEAFLAQRGLFKSKSSWNDCFNPGFLNKIYLKLNDVAFHGSKKAFILHLGDGEEELDMENVDLETQARPSTLGTGGGTDHDDYAIRPRPTYRWENILSDNPGWVHNWGRTRTWMSKFGAWFGIAPTWTVGPPLEAISIDIRLEGGRYVLLNGEGGEESWQPCADSEGSMAMRTT